MVRHHWQHCDRNEKWRTRNWPVLKDAGASSKKIPPWERRGGSAASTTPPKIISDGKQASRPIPPWRQRRQPKATVALDMVPPKLAVDSTASSASQLIPPQRAVESTASSALQQMPPQQAVESTANSATQQIPPQLAVESAAKPSEYEALVQALFADILYKEDEATGSNTTSNLSYEQWWSETQARYSALEAFRNTQSTGTTPTELERVLMPR